jgi:hypothetical protein
MGREIAWLESVHMRIQNLPELAAATRDKLAFADATANEALAALRSGNVRAAGQLARSVLEVVADHPGALEVARSTGRVAERVARVEELVGLGRWCAANGLLRDLEGEAASDPRLAKLRVRVGAALGDIDFNIRLLAVVLAVAVIGAGAGGSVVSPGLWFAGSGLLLAVIWWACGNKAQMLRRVVSPLLPRAGRGRSGADAGALASGTNIPPPAAPTVRLNDHDLLIEAVEPAEGPSKAAIIAAAPAAAGDESQPLSATEHIQRVEATAMAVEWLALGGLISWLSIFVPDWLAPKLGHSSWEMALSFGFRNALLVPLVLYVGGFHRWRPALLIAACFVPVLVLVTASGAAWAMLLALGLELIYLGVMICVAFRVPLRRGGWAALGGTAGALLVGSPIIIGFGMLTSLVVSSGGAHTPAQYSFRSGIATAAVIWCTVIAVGSTPSRTLVRHFLMDRSAIRGVFALGLALATASGLVFLVLLASTILDKDSVWLTGWVVWLAASQLVPPFLRWQGRPWFTIPRAVAGLATVGAVVLMDWLSAQSSVMVAFWVVACAAAITLDVRTMDIFSHKADVLRRLRLRLRSRRLPVRIAVTRA